MNRHVVAKGPLFNDDVSLIEAAIDGLGLALVRSRLVERELKQHTLVRLSDSDCPAAFAYYFVTPKGVTPPAPLQKLKDWLLAEAELIEREQIAPPTVSSAGAH